MLYLQAEHSGIRMRFYRAIGLMSGTSMDGIDVALVETDGRALANPGPASFYPYDESERALLRAAICEAADLDDRTARPGKVGEAERLITTRHCEAVDAFIAEHGLDRATIGVVGFHGQTVLHRPEKRLTIQIGAGAALATALHLPVVWDMRAADVAAGGQGAPLVPAWHRALVEAERLHGPVLVINLGGVANVTFVADGADPIAFDTGPANALIDDLMLERTGAPMDRDGAAAASGSVDAAALKCLLAHPYFAAPAPKSLDRNAFSRAAVAGLSTEDAAATLTAFTAALHRARREAAAGLAATGHRLRRGRAQSGVDGGARAGAAVPRAARQRPGLERRRDRGAGLRLSRRAGPGRAAAHVPDNDRGACAAHRRDRVAPLTAAATRPSALRGGPLSALAGVGRFTGLSRRRSR